MSNGYHKLPNISDEKQRIAQDLKENIPSPKDTSDAPAMYGILSVGGSIYDICVIIGTVAYAPPKALANIQNTRRHNIGAMKERIRNTAMKRFHSPFSFR